MIRVIDGLRYNTETAVLVAKWDNGLSYSDFNNLEESLYITVKGNWFLLGSGGPNSQYAKTVGNSSCGSSRIVPYEEFEAQDWLEKHNFTDELEAYFSDNIQDA